MENEVLPKGWFRDSNGVVKQLDETDDRPVAPELEAVVVPPVVEPTIEPTLPDKINQG